jgi:hypothetical protein
MAGLLELFEQFSKSSGQKTACATYHATQIVEQSA